MVFASEIFNFSSIERECMVRQLRDEYGDCEFSDELVNLELVDLYRKGCSNLAKDECHGNCNGDNGCPLLSWEKRHPEYKDDEIAKRLEELHEALRNENTAKIEKRLLAEGYVKVQIKRWSGCTLVTKPKLYKPGSNELMADIAKAIEEWHGIYGHFFELNKIDLNASTNVILSLGADQGDEYEIWEII